ncbi:MAG: type II toxin-antitoxin system RelE/ParE family toxin [Spirochaetaceae bacterium]|jgi:plasmid stabilization system protein ParE|nr:type II toxin-antitoxin system RelE/ParE family toxin [Spirochaetaceae bacterium]
MRYAVNGSSEVNQQISKSVEYIANELHNPQAAESHYAELDKALAMLEENPLIRPKVREPYLAALGVRSIMVKKYYLFYTVDEDNQTVQLISFMHSRMDWQGRLADMIE